MLKDANGKIVINSKEIKQRWTEQTENLYSRDVRIHDTIEEITYLQEPLILNFELRS